MDAVDRSILDALRINARATYADLARQVGLSAPSVHERVSKLESLGVIMGYHAAVDPKALGYTMTALVGVLLSDDSEDELVFKDLADSPSVEDCWFVAGEEAFVVKLRVADIDGLESTIRKLARIKGVARTRTTVVLSTRFEGRMQPAVADAASPAPLTEPGRQAKRRTTGW